MKQMFKAALFSVFVFVAIGCGGGGSSSTTPIPLPTPTPTPTPTAGLSVTPSSTTLGYNQSLKFKATNPDGSTATVNWSVDGVAGGNPSVGTITTSGTYTAPPPGTILPGKSVTITATSQTSSTSTASSTTILDDNADSQTVPVKLGTSGGNSKDSVSTATTITCCSGTLGSLWTRGAGNFFILSNNHVLDKSDSGTAGDAITQPGMVDTNCNPGSTVATLTEAVPLKPTTTSTTGACQGSTVPCGNAPKNVDAAIAAIAAGAVDTTGSILDLGAAAGNTIAAAPPSNTLATPTDVTPGNQVAKSGRSTGLTCNTLQSNGNFIVDYAQQCGGSKSFSAIFNNQVAINGANFSASGDSGSLVVTANNARPVGLLYAGSQTGTVAHPIGDVISALSNASGTLAIVGGPDHAVACTTVGNSTSATTTVSAESALSSQELQRGQAALDNLPQSFRRNGGIREIALGVSADHAREAALVFHVSDNSLSKTIPATVNGVRTRIVNDNATALQVPVALADFRRALAARDVHSQAMLGRDGIFGVAAGASDDSPGETALVFYVETGNTPEIPAVMDGFRTKIIEGERFRAYNWGKDAKPMPSACKPSARLPQVKAKLK